MAIDQKYGRVTLERGTVGEYEPVVVFRATDVLLPKVLAYYHLFCLGAGAARWHLDLILNSRDVVLRWQALHPARVSASKGARAWLDPAKVASDDAVDLP